MDDRVDNTISDPDWDFMIQESQVESDVTEEQLQDEQFILKLKSAAQELKTGVMAFEKTVRHHRRKSLTLEAINKELQAKMDSMSQSVESLQKTQDEKVQEIQKLQREISSLEEFGGKWKASHDSLQAKHLEVDREYASLQETNLELEHENEALLEDLAGSREARRDTDYKNRMLTQDLWAAKKAQRHTEEQLLALKDRGWLKRLFSWA